MKVTLVYPPPIPILSKYNNEENHLSGLGLLYLATAIKDKHDVNIIGGTTNPVPTDGIIGQILEIEPDIVGISTIFSTLVIGGRIIAQAIKKKLPHTKVIFGGNHATFLAAQLAAEEYVDLVVVGEGELTFKEVIDKIDRNQPLHDTRGLVFMENGKIIRTPMREAIRDLDSLPFPDWTLHYNKMPTSLPMCSSRGCPHDCIYCSTTSFWGRKWRPRSARNIVEEIGTVFNTFSPPNRSLEIGFVDDNFTVDRERVIEFARLLHQESGWDIKWGGSSRIEWVDPQLLQVMADSGCKDIFFGVESGSDRVLTKMNRRYDAKQIRETVAKCLELGILCICSFMIGNPYEDKSDIERTFALLKELKSYKVQVHIFTPLIGTEIYNNAKKFGVEILDNEYDTARLESKALLNTRYLTAKEIEKTYQKGIGLVLKRYREAQLLEKIAKRNRTSRKELAQGAAQSVRERGIS